MHPTRNDPAEQQRQKKGRHGSAGTAVTEQTESALANDTSPSVATDVRPQLGMSSAVPPAPNRQRGVVILLVAVVLLFVVGAMAALSIDVVTFYTARSEAQLAADAAALAAARVLANSGMTSNPVTDPNHANLVSATKILAGAIAKQVAAQNEVGGRLLNAATEVNVTFNDGSVSAALFATNPHVTVQVTRTDLPTFFARIWGTTTVGVQASAAAEAYNPSGASALPLGAAVTPVAPTCVKPWVLPNISPPGGVNNKIIDAATGAILDTSLVGRDLGGTRLYARCGGNCQPNWSTNATPIGWRYYPADPASFPSPVALPACAATLVNAYQLDIAGCVPAPITCGTTANGGTPINLDTSSHFGRNSQTADAVNCLTHTAANVAGDADSLSPAVTPGEPFEFLGGNNNPVPGAVGNNVIVSDSLVTVPIYDADSGDPAPTSPVTVIGFVQLLLNSDGVGVSDTAPNSGRIKTTVINVVGCGNGAPLPPILGNGASPVPVRLITPP